MDTIETLANDTTFSTKSPRLNVTDVIYFHREDVTEITIIVWAVGGVLLITLLALLGRIMLTRWKDPFSQMGYHRHRHNIVRVVIGSECLPYPTEHGFVVPRDTSGLITGAATPPTSSPMLERCSSSSRTTQGRAQSNNSNSQRHGPLTENHPQNSSVNSVSRSNTLSINTNNGDSNTTNNDTASFLVNQTRTINLHEVTNTITTDLQQSVSAISSNTVTCSTGSVLRHSAENSRNSEIRQTYASQEMSLQRTQAETAPRNGPVGSRAVLANGIVISPPPYCDVINTTARLPSIIVAGPPSRRLLYSL